MSLAISNRSIERVLILDDDIGARMAYSYSIQDLNLEPIRVDGPLLTIQGFLATIPNGAEAVICDHHLRKRQYANFDGAETVAALYCKKIPAVLYTRYEDIIDDIRPYRQYIPAMLAPDFEPESLVHGFRQCIEEFGQIFRPSRRPWRALVRVERIEEERSLVHVVIPAWDPDTVIRYPMEFLPEAMRNRLNVQLRFHAQINLGAETRDELYFKDWEV